LPTMEEAKGEDQEEEEGNENLDEMWLGAGK
jgi:hypothetical protein